MVRHTVYFWLIDGLTDEQKSDFEGGLKALFDIDVVQTGRYGVPAGTPTREGKTQNDFDYNLVLEFDSVADHDAYQIHPEHAVFVENFKALFDTVKIYDTEMKGA